MAPMQRMLPIVGVGLSATQFTSSQRSFRTGALRDKAAIAPYAFLAAKRTSDLFGVGLPTEVAYVAVAAAWTNLADGGQRPPISRNSLWTPSPALAGTGRLHRSNRRSSRQPWV